MPEEFIYNPVKGAIYAQAFALFDNVPDDEKLFYYAKDINCTNFISQCIWASYGGWKMGFDEKTVEENRIRIRKDIRQVKGIWYGSANNIGSNRWCRVVDFFDYVVDNLKNMGPMAELIDEGTFETIDPKTIQLGDVIQMVVTSYTKDRYGHAVYVTGEGETYDDILICCNSDDRLNEPLSWFAQFENIYSKIRIIRFKNAIFEA